MSPVHLTTLILGIALPTMLVSLLENDAAHWAEFYFAAAVFVFLLFSLPQSKNKSINWNPPSELIFVVVLGGLLRFSLLDHASLWQDETTQFLLSFEQSPVFASRLQQQMPLDYVFSYLSHLLFQYQEFAPRLFSAIWGSISCGIFYALCRVAIKGRLLSFLACLAFALSPWLVRYSSEGRPYSLAVLSCLLHFLVLTHIYKSKAKPELRDYLALSAASFVSLSATFLQNYIFLASSNLAFFLTFARGRNLFLKVLCFQGIAGLALLPLGVIVLLDSNAKRLLNWQPAPQWPHLLDTLKQTLLGSLEFLPTPNILFLFGMCLIVAIIPKLRRQSNKMLFTAALTAGVFILLFTATFSLFVDYPVHLRYSLTVLPLLILLQFQCFDCISRAVPAPQGKLISLSLAFIFIIGSGWDFRNLLTGKKEFYYMNDWRQMYGTLDHLGTHDDIVLNLRNWSFESLMGSDYFYLKNRDRFFLFPLNSKKIPAHLVRDFLNRQVSPKNLFLVSIWNEYPVFGTLPENVSEYIYRHVNLYHLRFSSNWKMNFFSFMRTIYERTPKNKSLENLSIQMEILMSMNHRQEAVPVFRELEKAGLRNYYPTLHTEYLHFLQNR